MEIVYILCALVGGTLIVCQFVMTLIGFSADHDTVDAGHHDLSPGASHDVSHSHEPTGHDSTNWLFKVISLRTVTAGLAFFGLTGWGLSVQPTPIDPIWVLLAAVAAGLLSVFIVYTLMRSLNKLNVDGTVRIQRAVGSRGTVYLSISGGNAGCGKVHVSINGQMREYKAVTAGGDLPTGAKIVVVKVVGSDTVEVSPAETPQETPANA